MYLDATKIIPKKLIRHIPEIAALPIFPKSESRLTEETPLSAVIINRIGIAK